MRSRSLATDFIRRESESVCKSGMASVRIVAIVAMATRRLNMNCRSSNFSAIASILDPSLAVPKVVELFCPTSSPI